MTEIIVLHTELEKYDGPKAGFSLLIKSNNKKILFDVAFLDDIQKNSRKGNISLQDIDYLVLSHGHRDHVEGLRFIDYYFVSISRRGFTQRYGRANHSSGGLCDSLAV